MKCVPYLPIFSKIRSQKKFIIFLFFIRRLSTFALLLPCAASFNLSILYRLLNITEEIIQCTVLEWIFFHTINILHSLFLLVETAGSFPWHREESCSISLSVTLVSTASSIPHLQYRRAYRDPPDADLNERNRLGEGIDQTRSVLE